MKRRRLSTVPFVLVQVGVVAAFAVAYASLPVDARTQVRSTLAGIPSYPEVQVERQEPLRIAPLYDEAEVVSHEELAAVLKQIRPKFPKEELKPNFVEHALRTWGVDATFQDPEVMSGQAMKDFLVDHARYIASWSQDRPEPLLVDRPRGVAIRWGRERGASVHHDHWLACLTEAGVRLDEPVYAPARRDMTINDVLQEALRDFRLDEREVEWSAMAFGFWLPPKKTWTLSDGRILSFDRLARRLIRGHKEFGVCSGTHRVYSAMVLWRLNQQFDILSDEVNDQVYAYLKDVRDLIIDSQFSDGRWPPNWPDGAEAVQNPQDSEPYRIVIATGHHLEWLAIAPEELHPPREQILRAADWIIEDTVSKTEEEIREHYTFYSHVGNALALWRGTRPADFWRQWQTTHPYVAEVSANGDKAESENDKPAEDGVFVPPAPSAPSEKNDGNKDEPAGK